MLNGGAHADSNVDVQEFMLAPVGAASFGEALRWGVETYHALKALLNERGLSTALGDEGGFAPNLPSNEEALALLLDRDRARRLHAGRGDRARARRRVDRALRRRPRTCSRAKAPTTRRRSGPGASSSCATATRSSRSRTAWPRTTGTGGPRSPTSLGARVQLVGDDLFVTNVERLQQGIDRGVANSILVKVNQIGTLSETLDTMFVAGRHGYTAMMSHRSGETEDTTIADLAVATNCGQIKTGAPARSDRVAKYNQLLRIEEELGPVAVVPRRGGVAGACRWTRWLSDAAPQRTAKREAARREHRARSPRGAAPRATAEAASRGAGRRCDLALVPAWCSSACCSRSCTRRARSSTSATTPTRRARSSRCCSPRTRGWRDESKRLQTDCEIERLAAASSTAW